METVIETSFDAKGHARVAHLVALVALGSVLGCGRSAPPRPPLSPHPTTPAEARSTKGAIVDTDAALCAPPTANEPRIDFEPKPMMPICHGVYVEPAAPWEQRERIKTWYGEASAVVSTFFDARVEAPNAIFCVTEACAEAFSGPTRRSRATMQPRPTVIVNGLGPLTRGTLIHEMIHIEIARRLRERPDPRELPAWFDEGVATFIGDNGQCTRDTRLAVDDVRRLRSSGAWTNFTNQPGKIEAAYCQVRDEVAAWTNTHGRRALVSVIDAVARGESFERSYGSLAVAPAALRKPDVVGFFALDERAGDAAIDTSGQRASASLLSGATRTAGHRGGGVRLAGGAYVRASGFDDLGLPDAPFSIALWVKPEKNANVLVHTAMLPSGAGWCVPILGSDREGRLVAQVLFDGSPNAFLSASGPALALHAWSHVVMTWSAADGVRLYVNGKLAASRSPQGEGQQHRDAPGSAMHLFVGAQADGKCWAGALESGAWAGTVDELRVFNHALSAEEVIEEAKR